MSIPLFYLDLDPLLGSHSPLKIFKVFWMILEHLKLGGGPGGSGGSEKHIWKIFYGGDREIGTPGTPRGSQGTKKIFWKIFSWKVIRVYVGRFRGYYGKRVIFRPKTVILKCLCYHSPTYSFLVKNHFFTTITPKPAYIYPNNFSKENFSKKNFGPLGPPWGTWGPYLGIPQ